MCGVCVNFIIDSTIIKRRLKNDGPSLLIRLMCISQNDTFVDSKKTEFHTLVRD